MALLYVNNLWFFPIPHYLPLLCILCDLSLACRRMLRKIIAHLRICVLANPNTSHCASLSGSHQQATPRSVPIGITLCAQFGTTKNIQHTFSGAIVRELA